MHESITVADAQQPKRLALFAGVFIAGMIGGAVFASSLTHSQHSRPAALGQVSAAPQAEAPTWTADTSVPDAGTVLKHRRHDRPEAVAPTF